MIHLGAAFFNQGSPKWPTHLHMLITDPEANPDAVVMVNATTAYEETVFDPACVLAGGEHPDITHESYITYLRLVTPSAQALEDGVFGGVLKVREDLSEELLRKVQLGLMKSKLAKRKFKKILEDQGFVVDPAEDEPN